MSRGTDLTRSYVGWIDDAAEMSTGYCSSLWQGWRDFTETTRRRNQLPPDKQEHLRASIWQIRQMLRVAMEEGIDQDLMTGLNRLAERRGEIERAFVVWVQLVEVLVEETERRYGSSPGKGSLKAAEVKEAVRYLVRDHRFNIPNVPPLLEPIVVEIAVDWIVNALVHVFNRYNLWTDAEPAPKGFARLVVFLWEAWRKLISPLLAPLAQLAVRIWGAMRVPVALSPALKAALDAVRREGVVAKEKELLDWTVALVQWIGEHGKSILAIIEVTFSAVQEVEEFLDMSGSEKKEYARDLVLAVLEELGFVQRSGLLFAIVDSMIGTVIESAVYLFHKHGVFSHRQSLAG